MIGLAGEHNHDWLRRHGIVPVSYGEGQADRIREAAGGTIDAFIDTFGRGYVDLAIELGVAPQRINTIIDYEAVQRLGVSVLHVSRRCDMVEIKNGFQPTWETVPHPARPWCRMPPRCRLGRSH